MSRIVQVANTTSGGVRTVLAHLADGYAGQGHEVVQLLPGPRDATAVTSWGRVVTVAAPEVPGLGLRLLPAARARAVLGGLEPDLLEVHDRTTLRGLGRWAAGEGVPSVVVCHERLDRWARQWLPWWLPLDALTERADRALVEAFDTVVCPSRWAAQGLARLGASNVRVVPLGVDPAAFRPPVGPSGADGLQLVLVSRLSREKRADLAVEALRELRRRGVDARLVVAGDGSQRRDLERLGRGLPVVWRGFVSDRAELAALLAQADVALAPGPVETFGLAALEALACGTPVVANRHCALPEVVGAAGRTAASSGFVLAEAVLDLLTTDEPVRREAARRRALELTWDATVRGFLGVHGLLRERVLA